MISERGTMETLISNGKCPEPLTYHRRGQWFKSTTAHYTFDSEQPIEPLAQEGRGVIVLLKYFER